VSNHARFCAALIEWAGLKEDSERPYLAEGETPRFANAWSEVHLQITKSCLLDRMLNCDESPSKTPCPVHQGKWSGIHMWGSREIEGRWHTVWVGRDGERLGDAETSGLAEWRARGCRCFKHRCGCTTGWQPDEHCGCVPSAPTPQPAEEKA
jgi:hypothetical protein